MKKKAQKLVLSRETLRELNPFDLTEPAGGLATTTSDLCSVESRCCYYSDRPINCQTF